MIDVAYEKLSMADRENFSRIVNQLLAHTFLVVDQYDANEQITRINKDYLFVERNFELFSDYFLLAGFRLERDGNYGVVHLVSSYEGNRRRFNKMATVMIFALRLIFEEEREKLTLSKEVIIKTGDLVHKMVTLGILARKPSNAELHETLRLLAHYRIIEKLDGIWEEAETRFLILPTILFIVTNEQISNMVKLLNDTEETESQTEEDEGDYEET